MKEYPIAESFVSIQGEGTYVGTPMHFIRLAGCSVGQYSAKSDPHSVCTSWDGHRFVCDTNYRMTSSMSVEQILRVTALMDHVCITGGEPCIHDLGVLCSALFSNHKRVHIETSGSVPVLKSLRDGRLAERTHIVCSPKLGFVEENREFIDEWKFIVAIGHKTVREYADIIASFLEKDRRRVSVYVQPVNHITMLDMDANQFAVDVVMELGGRARVSVQAHKVLGMR